MDMNTHWALDTHGDPLGTLQNFINTVWVQSSLDGMVVPINGSADAITQPRLIDHPKELGKVNPFKPLMTMNAARIIPDVVRQNPDQLYGALLRPCEVRALVEMVKQDSFEIENLLTISVDCLGTLPADEYEWRAERKQSSGGLAQEALQFARQGGILAYRYRSACQTCQSAQAQGADLNIYVLGLPVRQQILVAARNTETAERFQLNTISGSPAGDELIEQHSRVVARLNESHQRTMDRLRQSLVEYLPVDVDALVSQLESCGTCQECMDVCPICSVNYPQRDDQDRYQREDVMRWLVSCAGCGMCEQACSQHLPLSTIFGHIREQLASEYNYYPGRSISEPLPLQ
jgi:formate dehydrogenase subunit beta